VKFLSKAKADKLLHVQRGAIRELLLKKAEEDELIKHYRAVTKGETKNIREALSRLDKVTLIKIVKKCRLIGEEDIDECFEQYRYSRRPSFRLFSIHPFDTKFTSKKFIAKIRGDQGVDLLNESLADIPHPSEVFRQLTILDQQQLNNETVEFSFRFEEVYNYIEPETEESSSIYELKYGFLWINVDKRYISISSPADQLVPSLKRVVEKTFDCFVRDINITENVINSVFSKDNMKRTSLFHPEPPKGFPEKVSISDTNMAAKIEHLRGYDGYTVPSSLYEEEIEEDFYSTLGVNRNKGKIYLSRQLKASQLQTWGLQRIEQIIDYINHVISLDDTEEIFKTVGIENDEELKVFAPKKEERNMLLSLMKGIVACKKTGQSSYTLDGLTTENLVKNLKKHVIAEFHPYCDKCENHTRITCPGCGSSNFNYLKVSKDSTQVICHGCFQTVPINKIKCLSDHTIKISSIYEGVLVKPQIILAEVIEKLMNRYFPKLGFNTTGEYFFFQNNELLYTNRTATKVVFKVSELEQFETLWNRDISDGRKAKLEEILKSIKEKCSKHSNEACIACQAEKSILCIMKPFVTFTDHELHPHHGHEFGDVSFRLQIPHINLTDAVFVGMAKSYEDGIIFASKSLGREMIQQFVSKCQDARPHVLGLICAARLDQGLVAMCEDLARRYGKKVVMWQFDELLKVLDYAIDHYGIELDEVKKAIDEDTPERGKGKRKIKKKAV
jgi:hypothetical protein